MNSIQNRLTTLRRDERGVSTMLIGFGMVGFLGATVLALDTGWWLVARTQAQNAADAGALAGAVALVYNDFDDRTPERAGRAERARGGTRQPGDAAANVLPRPVPTTSRFRPVRPG